MLLVICAIFVSSVFSLMPSVLTGRIIDEGLIGRNMSALVRLIILSLAVTLGANLIGVLESYLNTWIAQHITFDMRNAMFRHLQKMSQSFFTANNQGDIITRMTSDIDGVQSIITNTLSSILSNAITLLVAVVVMYRENWILATVDETLSVSGQLLVKLFGKEEKEYEKYRAANEKMINLNIREGMAGRWFRVVISTFSSIGPMLLYLVGGILMMQYDADLTVGDITVLVALLGRMYGPVNQLLNIQVDWIRSMAMFTRIFEYYDMPIEIQNAPDAVIPERATGEVTFEHVAFSYNKERQILKDVNFELKSGHSVAIVGPSGSGKSTMINLIPMMWMRGELHLKELMSESST